MIFTKTEIRVLELFVSQILNSFSIRGVARLIKKDLKIVHTSIKNLVSKGFFIEEKNGIRLNYRDNIPYLAYIETIRKERFFKKHHLIKIHITNFIMKCSQKFFVLLVFGSYAEGREKKRSDIDLLAIVPFGHEKFERELRSILSNMNFHINVIGEDSFREMIKKRGEFNIVNETFNNHIILYGAEQYYALLGGRDVK